MPYKLSKKGFTLIELLIVLGIIAILSGVVISIINPAQSRNKAGDGVIRSNIAKIVQGVEAYRTVEGRYPVNDATKEVEPQGVGTNPPIGVGPYISDWPDETPRGAIYKYSTDVDGEKFVVFSPALSISPQLPANNVYILYYSDNKKVQDCEFAAEPTVGSEFGENCD